MNIFVIPTEVEEWSEGASDMDGCAAMVAARESGDERVQSLTISVVVSSVSTEIFRDVSTSLNMTTLGAL